MMATKRNLNKEHKHHYKHQRKEKEKFCPYHKTNTHDKTSCRALKEQNFTKGKGETNRDKNQKGSNTMMKETITDRQTLETEVTINKNSYVFLLDIGSAFSYINEKIVTENNLKTEETTRNTAILVDGSTVESSSVANFELDLQGDVTTKYKSKTRILNSM
ncbi:hypothetical protein DMUE_0468 [Dictyocoela muelleri]|nr:hypothetical protein DMUE_0468 [Dictyocoela muelleri]